MISPRTSPVFLIFSALSGEARARRLTTGVPIIIGDAGVLLKPTDFIGVSITIIELFSFPSATTISSGLVGIAGGGNLAAELA